MTTEQTESSNTAERTPLPPMPPKWTGKFRKRPLVVEAVLLTRENVVDVMRWVAPAVKTGLAVDVTIDIDKGLTVSTIEGDMRADYGWWVIKGVAGEFYPCDPAIFEATYAPATSEPKPEPEPELAAAVAALEDIARAAQGHADSTGTVDHNWLVETALLGLGRMPASEDEQAEAADVRPRADGQRGLDITCGACDEDYGTNVTDLDEIKCVECDARRCPHCKSWFGGQS